MQGKSGKRIAIWSQCKSLHLMVLMISSREVTVKLERKEESFTGEWPHPPIISSWFLSNSHYFLCHFPPWGNTLFLSQVNLLSFQLEFP